LFWLSPPSIPPTAERIEAITTILNEIFLSKYKGAIFCQVNKIKHWIQLHVSVTCGNQKWKGTAPALIRRARVIKISEISIVPDEEASKFNAAQKTKIKEAMACGIKYFSLASVDE